MKRKSSSARWPRALNLIAAAVAVAVLIGAPIVSAGTLADAKTHVEVWTLLLEKLGTDALHIDVDVHGGHVVLSGTVEKKPTEELAREVALSVKGVTQVDNRIRVAGDSGSSVKGAVAEAKTAVKDALLEAKVKGRLLDQVGVNALKIDVEASGGVVSLRGTVPSGSIRETAVATARKTESVVKVVDLLRVA